MPKLLLRFNSRALKVVDLESEPQVSLGRDPSCDLRVDSIHCAPQHAQIVYSETEGSQISPVDEEHFPLVINDRKLSGSHTLTQGDLMEFGDYSLEFMESSVNYESDGGKSEDEDNRLWSVKIANSLPAFIQILSGSKMGRIIKLTKETLPLGGRDDPSATINHKDDVYYLHIAPDPKRKVLLNGDPPDQQLTELKNGDVIEVDSLKVEFQRD